MNHKLRCRSDCAGTIFQFLVVGRRFRNWQHREISEADAAIPNCRWSDAEKTTPSRPLSNRQQLRLTSDRVSFLAPSFPPSVCLSVCLSACRRVCVSLSSCPNRQPARLSAKTNCILSVVATARRRLTDWPCTAAQLPARYCDRLASSFTASITSVNLYTTLLHARTAWICLTWLID